MIVYLRDLSIAAVVLFLTVSVAPSAAVCEPMITVPDRERVCMVQDTVMTVPAVPVTQNGKTYYGCCEMCKGRIAADPERYTLASDPVSGKVVDKATAALLSVNGRVFYFESEGNRDRFGSDQLKSAPSRVTGQ